MPESRIPERHQLLNSDLSLAHSETVCVNEREESGKGTIFFSVSCECLCLRIPNEPIKWLKERRSADAVIFEFTDSDVILHLVELKSKVSIGTWASIKRQFVGALHNAQAISGVLGIRFSENVKVHLAYKVDAISASSTAAPSTLKPGMGEPISGARDWIARRIQLDGFNNVPVALIKRDETSGDGYGTLDS